MSLMSSFARFNPRRIWRTLQMVQPLREQVARDHKEMLRELRAMRRAAEQNHVRLEDALAAHEKALAGLPVLQAHVERCMAAYQDDARSGDRIAAFRAMVNPDVVKEHARQAAARAQLQWNPCPYVVLDRVLPEDVYTKLVKSLPSPVFFDKVTEDRDEMPVPFLFAPAYSRLVWGLFHDVIEQALLPALVETFRPALDQFIRASWPTLGSWVESQITLRVANPRLMLRRPGYVIKPHRDPRWAFLTAIFYLSPRNAEQAYGTQLYRLRVERDEPHNSPFWPDPEECELVRDVPGTGNTALVFCNWTGAHGAYIPADAPPDFLRYVYQARFSPDPATKARLIDLLEAEARDRWVVAR
jgi:hypothetical protein